MWINYVSWFTLQVKLTTPKVEVAVGCMSHLGKSLKKVPEFTLKRLGTLVFYPVDFDSSMVHPMCTQRFPNLGSPSCSLMSFKSQNCLQSSIGSLLMVPICWVLLVSWRERGRQGLGLEIGHPKFARSQFDWPTTKKWNLLELWTCQKIGLWCSFPFAHMYKLWYLDFGQTLR